MHMRNTMTSLTPRTVVNRLMVFLGAVNRSTNGDGLNISTYHVVGGHSEPQRRSPPHIHVALVTY